MSSNRTRPCNKLSTNHNKIRIKLVDYPHVICYDLWKIWCHIIYIYSVVLKYLIKRVNYSQLTSPSLYSPSNPSPAGYIDKHVPSRCTCVCILNYLAQVSHFSSPLEFIFNDRHMDSSWYYVFLEILLINEMHRAIDWVFFFFLF